MSEMQPFGLVGTRQSPVLKLNETYGRRGAKAAAVGTDAMRGIGPC